MSYSEALLTDALLDDIRRSVKTIALVGASHNPARPSYGVMAFLLASGYRVIPVNPGLAGQALQGQTVYATLADIPGPPGSIDMVDVFRTSDAVPAIAREAMAIGAKVLWTQLGVFHAEAANEALAAGLTVVMDRCPAIEFPRLAAQ